MLRWLRWRGSWRRRASAWCGRGWGRGAWQSGCCRHQYSRYIILCRSLYIVFIQFVTTVEIYFIALVLITTAAVWCWLDKDCPGCSKGRALLMAGSLNRMAGSLNITVGSLNIRVGSLNRMSGSGYCWLHVDPPGVPEARYSCPA